MDMIDNFKYGIKDDDSGFQPWEREKASISIMLALPMLITWRHRELWAYLERGKRSWMYHYRASNGGAQLSDVWKR